MADVIDEYQINVNDILVDVVIEIDAEEPVPKYMLSIINISDTTKVILEKIREEFISKAAFKDIEREDEETIHDIKKNFEIEITKLLRKYFPQIDRKTQSMLINYILEENIGLGKIEIMLKDPSLEEIVVNNHQEPVWVYHKRHGWLKTNVIMVSENRIRHLATIIGREKGKEITLLNPLMDASLITGDRVNATLMPISTAGNTITIRKFASDPWTITKFIKTGTISFAAAALLWLAIQNEFSVLIAGGTGSGKTSMLNVVSNFFPANQRIISIEDTRELTLPKVLHWVPLQTRMANPEGKGEITMLDLLVNTLRMRPDRILVGEIRRQKEAQVLLEAIHTGHSVYATIHANNADEVVTRLTSPPISIPKPMVSALAMVIVQNRNRRTGKRRTLQIAEVLPTGDANVLLQLNVQTDTMEKIRDSSALMTRINLYTGLSREQIKEDLDGKVKVLKWLVKNNIEDVHKIGLILAKYYNNTLKIIG